MKEFIKENWFKVIIVIILLVIISIYVLVKFQKDSSDQLNLFTDDKVQTTEEIWEDVDIENIPEDVWEGW